MTEHLIDHRYTVLEIERMRLAVFKLMFPVVYHSRTSGSRRGVGGLPGETEAKVEVQLRTYMLNGTRPEELEVLQKEREEQQEKHRLSLPDRASIQGYVDGRTMRQGAYSTSGMTEQAEREVG